MRLSRKRSFGAWVGKPDHLMRVEGLVAEALRGAFEASRSEIQVLPPYVREAAMAGFSPETMVQAAAGRLERRGRLKAILADMDAREVERVTIGNSGSRFAGDPPIVKLVFGRDPRYSSLGGGVELEVTGSDRQWVSGTYESLSTEIAKDVPWWSWLLGVRALLGFLVGGYLAFDAVLFALTRDHQPTLAASFVTGLAGAGLGLLVRGFLRWLLSDFEVVEPGERSRAGKAGAALLVLIALVSGVVTIWAFLRG